MLESDPTIEVTAEVRSPRSPPPPPPVELGADEGVASDAEEGEESRDTEEEETGKLSFDDDEAEDSGVSTDEKVEEAGASSSDEVEEVLVGATTGAVTDPPEDAVVLPLSSSVLVTILVEVGSTDSPTEVAVELGEIPPMRLEIPPIIPPPPPPPPTDDEDGTESSSVLVDEACTRLAVEVGSSSSEIVEVRDGVASSFVELLEGVAVSSLSAEDEEGSRELNEEAEEEVPPITGTVISLASADRVDVTGSSSSSRLLEEEAERVEVGSSLVVELFDPNICVS